MATCAQKLADQRRGQGAGPMVTTGQHVAVTGFGHVYNDVLHSRGSDNPAARVPVMFWLSTTLTSMNSVVF